MGQLSQTRFKAFVDASHLYFDWITVLNDAGVKDIQDLNGQYLLKCPFHEDWNPSFRIRLHEHYYHCFSCGDFGSVAKLMYKTSGTTLQQSQYFEQILKANPAMQRYLGFSSLFIDSKTLDPAFETRRKFSAKDHIGSSMPVSALARKVRGISDSWESLAYSLTLLQNGETTDNVCANMMNMKKNTEQSTKSVERISLLSLTDDVEENND